MTNIDNSASAMRYYASLTDDELRELAIEFRNEILDELRRREETMEAKAEERKESKYRFTPEPWPGFDAETLRGYHIPTWPYAR